MNYRDLAERLWWTLVAAFLGALTVSGLLDISAIDAALSATAAAGVNFLLVVARARLAILPDPGAGLPGLPTDDTVNIAERLDGDRGAVELVGLLTVVALIVAIACGLKFLGVI